MNEIASSIVARLQSMVLTTPTSEQTAMENGNKGKPPILSTVQDTKKINKLNKSVRNIVSCCLQKGMNLRTSPPFLVQLANETKEYLFNIMFKTPNILEQNTYLQEFVTNFMSKCKDIENIFKDFGKEMCNPNCEGRKRLVKKSLIFSHMFHELKAEFPNYEFASEYRFTKAQAATFWKTNFGNKTTVPWNDFRVAISNLNRDLIHRNTANLKNTIDLTRTENISNYEFDIFTRLFTPWDRLIDVWHVLTMHPAYAVFMTYEEIMERLRTKKPGSYMFRMSATNMGNWAIGYIASDGKAYQTIPKNKSMIEALVEGVRGRFYLYPDGQTDNVDLSGFFSSFIETRIHVDSEQQKLYSAIGTTYELCKICDERDKNIRLEPCDHLLCSVCLKNWQDCSLENSTLCPFCREPIRGAEPVVIRNAYSRPKSGDLDKKVQEEEPPKSPAPVCPKRSRPANISLPSPVSNSGN